MAKIVRTNWDELDVDWPDIIDRYNKGASVRQLARHVGMPHQSMLRRLHDRGVRMRPPGFAMSDANAGGWKPRPGVTPLPEAEVLRLRRLVGLLPPEAKVAA